MQMLAQMAEHHGFLPSPRPTEDDPNAAEAWTSGAEATADSSEDGRLLALLDVTLADPRHTVAEGDVYHLGTRHILVCADVLTGWPHWVPYLDGPDWICCPYPGPFVVLSQKADTHRLLLIQPVPYLCGHILDRYADIHGEAAIVLLHEGSV